MERGDVTRLTDAEHLNVCLDDLPNQLWYLTDDHTLEHFKTEFWFPTLLDRKPWEAWEAEGGKSLGERVQEKLNHILDTHAVPPLPELTKEKIDAILAEAEARVSGS